MQKTIRQSKELAMGVADIMSRVPLIRKESEVFPYIFAVVADDIRSSSDSFDWDAISSLNFNDDMSKEIDFAETRTISIPDEDWSFVGNNFLRETRLKRLQCQYLVKLCMLYTRQKLRENEHIDDNPIKPRIIVNERELDTLDFLGKIIALLQSSDDPKSQKKLNMINDILTI